MKKSSAVSVFLLALAANACKDDPPDIKHCVDAKGVVVPERFCNMPDGGANWFTDPKVVQSFTTEERHYYDTYIVPQVHLYPTYVPHYMWHYDTVVVPVGNRVWSGSYAPSVGRSYYTPSAYKSVSVSRGGFGSVGRSFSVSSAS